MNFQTLHKQRKMILIAAALGLIATFLPWFRVSVLGVGDSMNAFHGIGFLVFLGFAAAGAAAFLGTQTTSLPKNMWFLALGGGAVALLCTIIYWAQLPDVPSGMGGSSIGLYLSLLAAAGVIAFAWMNRSPGDSIQSGFDALKGDITNRMNQGNDSSRPGGSL